MLFWLREFAIDPALSYVTHPASVQRWAISDSQDLDLFGTLGSIRWDPDLLVSDPNPKQDPDPFQDPHPFWDLDYCELNTKFNNFVYVQRIFIFVLALKDVIFLRI